MRTISAAIVKQLLRSDTGVSDVGKEEAGSEMAKMVNGVKDEVKVNGIMHEAGEGEVEGESEVAFGEIDGGVVVEVEVCEDRVPEQGDEESVKAGEVEELGGEKEVLGEWWDEEVEEEVGVADFREGPVEQDAFEEKLEADVVEEKVEVTSAQWIEDITEHQEEKQGVQDQEAQEIAEVPQAKQDDAQEEKQKTESNPREEEKQVTEAWEEVEDEKREKQENPVEEKKAVQEDTPKVAESPQQPEPEKEVEKPEPKPVESKPSGLSQSRWSTTPSSKKVLDPRATTFQPTEFKTSVKSHYQYSVPTTTRPQSSTPLAYSSIGVLASSSTSSPLSAYSQPSIFSSMGRSTQSSTPSYDDYAQSPSYGYTYATTSSYGNSPSYTNSSTYANTPSYANTSSYGNTSAYGNSSYSCYTPSPYYSSYNYASAS